MSKPPKISVLMSVHNGEAFLQEAISSISQQTETDFEFLIIDDGSTDGTSRILDQFAKSDSRLKILNQNCQGLTKSLNRALKESRGQFIARMDADDIAYPNRFEEQVRFLSENLQTVAVGSSLQLIDADGDPLWIQQASVSKEEIETKLATGHGAIAHPSAIIRGEAIRKLNGYDESFRYAQDLDLWLRLSNEGDLANLQQPLLKYRLHMTSITTGKRVDQLQNAKRAVEKAGKSTKVIQQWIDEAKQSSGPSEIQIELQWMDLAAAEGNFQTAKKYAWRHMARNPLSVSRWKKILRLRRQARKHLTENKNLEAA